MDAETFSKERAVLAEKVDACAEKVTALKAANAAAEEVKTAVSELRKAKEALKTAIKAYTKQFASEKLDIDRDALDDLLRRRFFYCNSFEIYGGVKGLYDLGHPGATMQAKIIDTWRHEFLVRDESLFELDCTAVTPQVVLDASGHTAKFCDWMMESADGSEFVRADHMLEEWLDAAIEDGREGASEDRGRVEDMGQAELTAALKKWFVPVPEPKKKGKKKDNAPPKMLTYDECWSEPRAFNVMFETAIGPSGKSRGFLRPETAQGMFVNFRRLLDYAGGKVPFGAAQVGKAYRNEISPAQGLLRVREFCLAEIEYFVHPDRKEHADFFSVADTELTLFPANAQLGDRKLVKMTAAEAVKQGVVASQALCYFMVRTWQFLIKVGINPAHLRMRQHLPNEMAHYAKDCYDAEILTTYGWIEVVGHADRHAYDLNAHSEASKTKLEVNEAWKEEDWKVVDVVTPTLNMKKLGPALGARAKVVMPLLKELGTTDPAAALALEAELAASGTATFDCGDGEPVTLSRDQVSYKEEKLTIKNEVYQPAVIEPAFGLGRIMYCVFEHSFRQREVERETEKRNFLSLPPAIAPITCSILPLKTSCPQQLAVVQRIKDLLLNHRISVKTDTVGESIGRRYARTDEIGIPFGITVDNETVEEGHADFESVTLRDRDSCTQIRVPIDGIVAAVREKMAQ